MDTGSSRAPTEWLDASTETRARIGAAIAKGSREPFQGILGAALANAPTDDDWEALSQRAPDKYVRAVRDLAPLAHAAYEPRSRVDHAHVTLDANAVAMEMVRRFGVDKAKTMLEATGMPGALAHQAQAAIDGVNTDADNGQLEP